MSVNTKTYTPTKIKGRRRGGTYGQTQEKTANLKSRRVDVW